MNASMFTFGVVLTMALVAISTLVAGYLLAKLRARDTVSDLEKKLSFAEEDLKNHKLELEKQSDLERIHRDLEIEMNRLDARYKALESNYLKMQSWYESLEQKLDLESKAKHEAEKTAKTLEAHAAEAEKKVNEKGAQHSALEKKYDELNQLHLKLSSDYTELKTSLEERDKSHQQQVSQFAEQKAALNKEFENLANKIFEEKGKSFSETSKNSIDSMLKPFREQIDGFQKRINDIHSESLKGNTSLNAEIKKVLDVGLKMSEEASNLTSALKGDSQQRGAWGEAQLRRTLEMSGLIEDAHFETQSSFKDLDGKQKQTDYIVKLPDNKHIIIDSKVSLVAYDRAVSADTPEAQEIAMSEHVKAVKKHIDDLASKDYTNLVGVRSPSFVLMFMPIEPAYIDALRANKELFGYGYEKGIVLVSHTTLIPILRTVANLWMMERSNAEAREISDKAGEIFNQVCIVADRLQKLGGTLSTVSNHYNNTVTALVGQQGLYGKVERFSQISNKVSKSMPNLEPSHIDFESERLALAVVPDETDEPQAELSDNVEVGAEE